MSSVFKILRSIWLASFWGYKLWPHYGMLILILKLVSSLWKQMRPPKRGPCGRTMKHAESWELNSHLLEICLTLRQFWLQGSPHLCQEKQGSQSVRHGNFTVWALHIQNASAGRVQTNSNDSNQGPIKHRGLEEMFLLTSLIKWLHKTESCKRINVKFVLFKTNIFKGYSVTASTLSLLRKERQSFPVLYHKDSIYRNIFLKYRMIQTNTFQPLQRHFFSL